MDVHSGRIIIIKQDGGGIKPAGATVITALNRQI